MGQPKTTFRAGNVNVAIFENEGKDSQGNSFSYDTVQLQRSYQDKNENWVNETVNLRRNDIQKVMLVLQKAQDSVLSTDKEE